MKADKDSLEQTVRTALRSTAIVAVVLTAAIYLAKGAEKYIGMFLERTTGAEIQRRYEPNNTSPPRYELPDIFKYR